MTLLPTPSTEQQLILDDLFVFGKNVTVDAVAGTGKTTTILCALLYALKRDPQSKIAQLSYNKELVKSMRLILNDYYKDWKRRVFVGTFHSLISSLTSGVVENDLLFLEVLSTTNFKSKPWKYNDFDFLIVDEGQDMRESYFILVYLKLLFHVGLKENVQLLLVGSTFQLLYGFYAINRADARFLTMMPQLLPCERGWSQRQLSISYRSTQPMANFYNALFPDRLTIPRPASIEQRSQEKYVTILVADIYNQAANKYLLPLAQEYKQTELMILCSSLNSKSPAVKLVDCFVQHGIPVHVARSGTLTDGGGNSMDTHHSSTQNKVVLKTKHASKGLQAPRVIDFVIDNIFLKNHVLDNAEYVGMTRASVELYIVIHSRTVTKNQIRQFLQRTKLTQRDLRIVVDGELKEGTPGDEMFKEDEQKKDDLIPTTFMAPTIFSFIDVTHLQKLLKLINITQEQKPIASLVEEEDELSTQLNRSMLEDYFHQMNITFDQGITFVNVTQICGVAITLALEYTVTRNIPLCASKMLTACCSKGEDLKFKNLRLRMERCLAQFQRPTRLESMDYSPTMVFSRFKLFAEMATLLDAFVAYGDKLPLLKNYDFIDKACVFHRYVALFQSLLKIIATFNISPQNLIWYKEDIGRFKYDGKSISIIAKPTILSQCGSLLIDVVHAPQITHEHHLSALLSAQVAGDANTNVFIINVGDGAIERSQIIHNETNKEQASLQFVSAAMAFKLYKEEGMSDTAFLRKYSKMIQQHRKN